MSSLAISRSGRAPGQRPCRVTAPSLVDAVYGPRIRTSRRSAAAFSIGRQPEESATRCKQPQSGDTKCDHTLVIVQSCSAAASQLLDARCHKLLGLNAATAPQLVVMKRASDSL